MSIPWILCLGILIPAAKDEVLFPLKQNNFLLPDLQSFVVDYLYSPTASGYIRNCYGFFLFLNEYSLALLLNNNLRV